MWLIVAHLETFPVAAARPQNAIHSRRRVEQYFIFALVAQCTPLHLSHTRVFALDPQADNTQKHNTKNFGRKVYVLEAHFRFLADRFSHAANVSIFNEHAIRRFYASFCESKEMREKMYIA
jgi:hypothetical protein